MTPGQLFPDLKASVAELQDRYPKLTDDERFLAWFLRAYVTDSDDHAANAVVGESGDKGVDGLLVDDAARAVFIVQAKYRHRLEEKAESRRACAAPRRHLAEALLWHTVGGRQPLRRTATDGSGDLPPPVTQQL
jgi:hypothetical protein